MGVVVMLSVDLLHSPSPRWLKELNLTNLSIDNVDFDDLTLRVIVAGDLEIVAI